MRIIKILIALILIAGIFGITGLYSQLEDLGSVSTFFHELFFQSDWMFYFYQVVLITLIVILFIAFWLVLFKPITKKEIHIKKEMGQINLPLGTLESIAKGSLQGIVDVDSAQVKVKLTKKQAADVKIIVADDQKLVAKGQEIQKQVAVALANTAQLETKKVKVVFKKKKNDTALMPTGKKQSRVV